MCWSPAQEAGVDQDLILLSRFLPPASTGTSKVSKHFSICVTFHMYHNYLCARNVFLCCNVAMSALIQKQGCTKTKKVGPSPAFPSATSKAESFEQCPERCPTLWQAWPSWEIHPTSFLIPAFLAGARPPPCQTADATRALDK